MKITIELTDDEFTVEGHPARDALLTLLGAMGENDAAESILRAYDVGASDAGADAPVSDAPAEPVPFDTDDETADTPTEDELTAALRAWAKTKENPAQALSSLLEPWGCTWPEARKTGDIAGIAKALRNAGGDI